jgi:hypothetical protein
MNDKFTYEIPKVKFSVWVCVQIVKLLLACNELAVKIVLHVTICFFEEMSKTEKGPVGSVDAVALFSTIPLRIRLKAILIYPGMRY